MASGSINARPEPPQQPGLQPGRAGEKGLAGAAGAERPRGEVDGQGEGGGGGGGRSKGRARFASLPGRGRHLRGGLSPCGGDAPAAAASPAPCGGTHGAGAATDPPILTHPPHGWKRGPRGLPAGLGHNRRVAFPATGANCKRPIKSERRKVINGPFAFKRGPRPESVSHQEKGWRGERLRLGVRRFSKLPRPPRSGTLWRSKSVAALAPSSPEPLMDTGAGAGRSLVIRESGPAGAVLPISYEAGS